MAKSLEELAREAVRLQLAHRSPPKAQALLKVLSKNTSDKPKQQASPKIQHGKPSPNPLFRHISPEELERRRGLLLLLSLYLFYLIQD